MSKKRATAVKDDRGSTSSRSLPQGVMWHQDDAEFRRRVEQKAYELFERRGGEPGHDLEDWLEAERLIKEQSRSGASS